MEKIKRTILLEDIISRKPNGTYGTITGDSFYVKIMLTQNYDDMGIFESFDSEKFGLTGGTLYDYSISGETGLRYVTDGVDRYTTNPYHLSGFTEDRLEDVKSYDRNNLYQNGLDIEKSNYINYTGGSIDGRTRVTDSSDPLEYVIDANNDANIGTLNQDDGFFLQTFSGRSRNVTVNGVNRTIKMTKINYKSQGWNESNVGHSGLTKQEYLFGITSEPEVFSDVFIERGILSVKEKHLKLSEVKSLDDLVNYGNGFFKVTKSY